MSRIGIGLIGVGKHGVRYATHITRDLADDLRLVAIARRNLEAGRRQAAEFGCRAYGDYRELIAAPDVEAIIVVVPPTMHPEIMAAAAAARRPVLLEKPAAANLADGERIRRAVHSAGIAVMVAQTVRYASVVPVLLRKRETIGPLHALRLSQRFEPSRPGWLDDPSVAGGGMTLHTGVHVFDLARLLTGLEADRVSCEMARVSTTHTEDNFAAIIRFGGGTVLADIAGSRATASRCGAIEMAGAQGQLIADHVFNTASIARGAVCTSLPVPPPVPTVLEVLRDFIRALRCDGPMPISLEDGLRAVAIADACYRSAASGKAAAVTQL
ncbi:MAG TPA: Gfo/Idh/MocA family oxidoreductase [Candidatus Margulisiibacteriota bacterium]|nr:Gfo/Idh/MocA family oxidoreductase [Candidatus Margulisiibacteriota bacterium]